MDSFRLQKVDMSQRVLKSLSELLQCLYNVIWQTPLLTHPAMSTWFMNDPKSS